MWIYRIYLVVLGGIGCTDSKEGGPTYGNEWTEWAKDVGNLIRKKTKKETENVVWGGDVLLQ